MAITPVDIAYYVSLGEGLAKKGKPGTGYYLSDAEYLKAHGVLTEAEREAERAEKAGGATARGAKTRQDQFLTAQGFGAGFRGRAQKALDPVIESYGLRNTAAGRDMARSAIDRALAARDTKRQEVSSGLATASEIQSGITTAILASNPITAAAAPFVKALGSGRSALLGASGAAIPSIREAEQRRRGTYVDPEDMLSRYFGDAGSGGGSAVEDAYAGRGGGGRDFYRQFQQS